MFWGMAHIWKFSILHMTTTSFSSKKIYVRKPQTWKHSAKTSCMSLRIITNIFEKAAPILNRKYNPIWSIGYDTGMDVGWSISAVHNERLWVELNRKAASWQVWAPAPPPAAGAPSEGPTHSNPRLLRYATSMPFCIHVVNVDTKVWNHHKVSKKLGWPVM